MRILCVDDDSSVLQALMAVLKTMPGHDVRVAANSQKAHEHAAALGGVDLLITDVVMEPTDGFTLRDELRALHPKMRAVFISGYDLSEYGAQIDGSLALTKPVDADMLRGIITGSVQDMVKAATAPKPVAVAVAAAVVPKGIPSAAPRAVAQPTATAAPRAAVAAPQPVAANVSRTAAPATPAADSNDPLIGVQLGDYRVQRLLGKGVWGAVYVAVQLSVNRPVGLKILDPTGSQDENARNLFLADARAKAAVQHPFIVSVFEADERNGLVFYTHEYLDGATLGEIIESGRQLDEKTILHVMKVASEGLNYLWSHNLAHGAIDASAIRLGSDGIPRLANLATSVPDANVSVQSEIQTVGAFSSQLAGASAVTPGLRALLSRMAGGPNAITTWPVVIQAVKALEPKIIPVEAAKMKAADAAALRAIDAARVAQKRALYLSFATLALLIAVVTWVVFKFFISNKRNLSAQIEIPAGSYMVGEVGSGLTYDCGAFEIDKYEVTIGDYADFIEWTKKEEMEGRDPFKFDHPNSRRHFVRNNDEIRSLISKARNTSTMFKQEANPAKGVKEDPGATVDLNYPIVAVTWWDAYAYAKWKNRDLPTEEEWEIAARGTKGFKYPWGDELKTKNFNSNEGYEPMQPGGAKSADGYNYWAPVDQFSNDESPFKVIGMAGNVAEWVYRKEKQKEIPLVKGGSFASPPVTMFDKVLTLPADEAWLVWPAKSKPTAGVPPRPGQSSLQFVGDAITADTRAFYIGFRTVKRK